MESTSSSIANSNNQMASSITLASPMNLAPDQPHGKGPNELSKTNDKSLDQMTKPMSDSKNMDRLAANQKTIVRLFGDLSAQNTDLLKIISERITASAIPIMRCDPAIESSAHGRTGTGRN